RKLPTNLTSIRLQTAIKSCLNNDINVSFALLRGTLQHAFSSTDPARATALCCHPVGAPHRCPATTVPRHRTRGPAPDPTADRQAGWHQSGYPAPAAPLRDVHNRSVPYAPGSAVWP